IASYCIPIRSRIVFRYSLRLSRRTVTRPGSGSCGSISKTERLIHSSMRRNCSAEGWGSSRGGMNPARICLSAFHPRSRLSSSSRSEVNESNETLALAPAPEWQPKQNSARIGSTSARNAIVPGASSARQSAPLGAPASSAKNAAAQATGLIAAWAIRRAHAIGCSRFIRQSRKDTGEFSSHSDIKQYLREVKLAVTRLPCVCVAKSAWDPEWGGPARKPPERRSTTTAKSHDSRAAALLRPAKARAAGSQIAVARLTTHHAMQEYTTSNKPMAAQSAALAHPDTSLTRLATPNSSAAV